MHADRKQPMRAIVFAALGLMFLGSSVPAFAGSLKYEIQKSAFAGMTEADLSPLKDPEHIVHVSEAAVETVKAAVADAEEEMKVAKKALEASEADLKAAKAELKAAKANEDKDRTTAAEKSIEVNKRAVAAGKSKIKWSKANIKALEADLVVAEMEMYREMAHLELARVQLLKSTGRDSAEGYIEADFKAQSLQSEIDAEKVRSKAEKKRGKAKVAKEKYEEALKAE